MVKTVFLVSSVIDRASFSKGFINNKKYEYGNYQKE